MGKESIFEGAGEMQARCRALDWSATSLGDPSGWPPALRVIVQTALTSPFPMNLWCGDDLVLIYNDAYRRVLGDKHPQALGRPGWEVWSEIWPQIQPMFEQIRAGGPAVYADDAPFHVMRAGEDAGTSEPNAWFTFSLSPVRDERGSIVAYLNVVSETTARIEAEKATQEARAEAERAEARLREVFAQAPAFLAVLRGREHTFEYVNAAYYQLVGHRELLGRPIVEALPEIRGQGFEELLDSVLQTGRPYVGREVAVRIQRVPDAEPEERFIDLVYYPINEPDGTRSGVVAHGSDVTEHVVARNEAVAARAEAEFANRAKTQFLANMSHEIRTPINAVLGYGDLLDAGIGGALTGAQVEYVSRIMKSGRHLLALVDDVLDLSKVEAGEMQVRPEVTQAELHVQDTIGMVAPQAAQKGVQLSSLCADAPPFLADPDRLRQILLNLLTNAIKFTPAGGSISVRCHGDDTHAYIQVEDTGQGIAPDQQESIFQAFVQADGGYTRRAGGTGLGLTISRHLALLMNGDLTVSSRLGRGSCFVLRLPRSPDGPSDPDA